MLHLLLLYFSGYQRQRIGKSCGCQNEAKVSCLAYVFLKSVFFAISFNSNGKNLLIEEMKKIPVLMYLLWDMHLCDEMYFVSN